MNTMQVAPPHQRTIYLFLLSIKNILHMPQMHNLYAEWSQVSPLWHYKSNIRALQRISPRIQCTSLSVNNLLIQGRESWQPDQVQPLHFNIMLWVERAVWNRNTYVMTFLCKDCEGGHLNWFSQDNGSSPLLHARPQMTNDGLD